MAYRKTDHPGITVYKRKNGAWYARWRDPDTRKYRYQSLADLGYATKTKASKWLKDKSQELRESATRIKASGRATGLAETWSSIEEKYLHHFAAKNGDLAAERTRRDWLRRWRDFLNRNQIATGGDLTTRHLSSFRDSLGRCDPPIAPATRNRTLGAVGALLRWARLNRFIRVSAEEREDALSPYKLERREPRILNTQQLKALICAVVEHDSERHFASRSQKDLYPRVEANAEGRPKHGEAKYVPLAPFTFLALLSGARPGEVLGLKWEDIRLAQREVYLWGSKTKRERIIPLHDSPALAALLRALHRTRNSNVHVCGDWEGGKPIQIHDRQWRRVLKKAGLAGCPMKVLRSTCIAHVASASPEPEFLLEDRFGHGSKVSKAHYRRPLHGLRERGSTVEEWLGIKNDLIQAMRSLKLIPKLAQRTPRKRVGLRKSK